MGEELTPTRSVAHLVYQCVILYNYIYYNIIIYMSQNRRVTRRGRLPESEVDVDATFNLLVKDADIISLECNVLRIYLVLESIYRFSGSQDVLFNNKEILYNIYGTTEGTKAQNKSINDGTD